jgi:hypothetical protein
MTKGYIAIELYSRIRFEECHMSKGKVIVVLSVYLEDGTPGSLGPILEPVSDRMYNPG